MTRKIGIIIADDHAVLRESFAALLNGESDFRVLAKAATGRETLAMVQQHRPDVLILDLFMSEGSGFDVLRSLDRNGSKVASIVLTASENHLDYAQAVRMGARGLVLKGDSPEKLFHAIRTVDSGQLAFSDDIAKQVVNSIATGPDLKTTSGMERLSERERRVAFLVARGLRNREIAVELGISENTVKRHLQSIFTKTGARDRLELAVMTLSDSSQAA